MDLLIEIICEDLPPADLSLIQENGAGLFGSILSRNRIDSGAVKLYATPRRIALRVAEVSGRQDPVTEKIKGPPYGIAVKEGKPTPAGRGFVSKLGVSFKDIKTEDTPKGKYLYCLKEHPGKPVKNLLKDIVKEFLGGFNFSITMKWPGCGVRFPRPIRGVLAMLGNTSVKFTLGNVKSSRTSRGHYLFSNRNIRIDTAENYEKILKMNYVIADPDKRKEAVIKALERALKYTSGHAVIEESLLTEVNNSLEFPTPVKGRFPEKYLKMPEEIIQACLIHHQRFFPVRDGRNRLLNYFVGVRDGISKHLETIRQGYERVLVARLEDAEFFLNKDRQKPLKGYVDDLKGIEFTRNLGTLYDKVQRISELTAEIGKSLGMSGDTVADAERAALLCKADLATHVVEEFPELEGEVGRIYASMDKEKKSVSLAISGHYKPRTFEDRVPDTDEAGMIAVADRLDTLCGNIGKGVEATGSQDPFGMRRTCRGLLRVLAEKGWDLDLDAFSDRAAEKYSGQKISFEQENIKNLKGFIFSQICQYLEENFNYDVARSVAANTEPNPSLLFKKARAVEKIKKTRGFDSLITAFKRIANILKQAGQRNIEIPAQYDGTRLEEEAETELAAAYRQSCGDIREKLKDKDFYEVLRILASLRRIVDRFFDEVLVMAPDKALMQNRLALLRNISEIFSPVGDISMLETKKEF
jgi:glycyl-tRNA synthetase beta chain